MFGVFDCGKRANRFDHHINVIDDNPFYNSIYPTFDLANNYAKKWLKEVRQKDIDFDLEVNKPHTYTWNANIEIRFLGRPVSITRSWNNSMYFYIDYCLVLNPKGDFESIPLGVDYLDAFKIEIDEEALNIWRIEQENKAKEIENKHREEDIALLSHHGDDVAKKLVDWLYNEPSHIREKIFTLMKIRKPRSKFKISLRQQILTWINTPESKRKYKFPLSRKQLLYV